MRLVNRPYLKLAATEYGAVLLDTKSGDYWELNPTSATIVSALLDGGRPRRPPTASPRSST